MFCGLTSKRRNKLWYFLSNIKNGHVENYKIKSFTMVNSTIRIKTDGNNILYLDYSDIEDIQIN